MCRRRGAFGPGVASSCDGAWHPVFAVRWGGLRPSFCLGPSWPMFPEAAPIPQVMGLVKGALIARQRFAAACRRTPSRVMAGLPVLAQPLGRVSALSVGPGLPAAAFLSRNRFARSPLVRLAFAVPIAHSKVVLEFLIVAMLGNVDVADAPAHSFPFRTTEFLALCWCTFETATESRSQVWDDPG